MLLCCRWLHKAFFIVQIISTMVENHKDKDCAFKEITLDLFRR